MPDITPEMDRIVYHLEQINAGRDISDTYQFVLRPDDGFWSALIVTHKTRHVAEFAHSRDPWQAIRGLAEKINE